jgi:hypothetical protein
MALNAKAIYDSQYFIFVALKPWLSVAPGAIDQGASVAFMMRATVLLGTICMVADLVCDPRWLLRLWWTLGLGGGSIALLGIIQKASGAPMIFWRASEQPLETFFATFYYHANAGAFLNLTLPLSIGLAWRSFHQPKRPLKRALSLTLAVVNAVAVFTNTSRMGQALGAVILCALILGSIPATFGMLRRRLEWSTAAVGLLALCFAIYAGLGTSRLDRSWKRLEETTAAMVFERSAPARAALAAVPEAGWCGFGPGTFAIIFPYYTAPFGEKLQGRWIFLHQDYVQTLLEWGWLGSACFGWIFFGGMVVGVRNLWRFAPDRRSRESKFAKRARQGLGNAHSPREVLGWTPRQRAFVPLSLLGLGSVALHALVDFPLQIASIQLYVAVLLGVCWGSGRWAAPIQGE